MFTIPPRQRLPVTRRLAIRARSVICIRIRIIIVIVKTSSRARARAPYAISSSRRTYTRQSCLLLHNKSTGYTSLKQSTTNYSLSSHHHHYHSSSSMVATFLARSLSSSASPAAALSSPPSLSRSSHRSLKPQPLPPSYSSNRSSSLSRSNIPLSDTDLGLFSASRRGRATRRAVASSVFRAKAKRSRGTR